MKRYFDLVCLLLLIGAYLWTEKDTQTIDLRSLLPDSYQGMQIAEIALGAELRTRINGAKAVRYSAKYLQEVYVVTVVECVDYPNIAHDPTFCIKGSGWEVIQESVLQSDYGEITILKTKQNNRIRYLAHFFLQQNGTYTSKIRFRLKNSLARIWSNNGKAVPLFVILDLGQNLPNKDTQNLLISDLQAAIYQMQSSRVENGSQTLWNPMSRKSDKFLVANSSTPW